MRTRGEGKMQGEREGEGKDDEGKRERGESEDEGRRER